MPAWRYSVINLLREAFKPSTEHGAHEPATRNENYLLKYIRPLLIYLSFLAGKAYVNNSVCSKIHFLNVGLT